MREALTVARRGAANSGRSPGRVGGTAQCGQVEPLQCPCPPRGGDRLANSRHYPGCHRGHEPRNAKAPVLWGPGLSRVTGATGEVVVAGAGLNHRPFRGSANHNLGSGPGQMPTAPSRSRSWPENAKLSKHRESLPMLAHPAQDRDLPHNLANEVQGLQINEGSVSRRRPVTRCRLAGARPCSPRQPQRLSRERRAGRRYPSERGEHYDPQRSNPHIVTPDIGHGRSHP